MFTLLAAALTLSPTQFTKAEGPEPQKLTERITLASMFKNGYAVLIREMDVPRGGDYILQRIPEASLGTLWFSTSDGAKLTSVTNTEVMAKGTLPVPSMQELLALNIGKRVTLTLNGDQTVSGTLLSVAGTMLELKLGDQTTVIDRSAVTRVVSTDTLNDMTSYESRSRGLRFRVDSKGAAKIFMLSLERGMSWSPAYAVSLKEGKKLEVVGKATITDDLEALDGVEARFVTGWPNLTYAGSKDPLVETLGGMAAGLPPGGFGGPGGGFGGGQFANQARAAADFAPAMPISDLKGIQAEDLFFYRQPDVRLKLGDRGYYIVLSTEAPYDELYTWDVPDFINDAQYAGGGIVSAPQDVWHTIRFANTSKVPFSTGPATLMKDGQIIGQDEMKYTPAGGRAELRITQALDLSADQLEEEVSRDRGVLKNVYNYDLVTLKGTLMLTNHKAEPVPVRIRKDLTGDVVSSSGSAKITKVARGLRDTNSHAVIEWSDTVPPGKTETATYVYKVYIRS